MGYTKEYKAPAPGSFGLGGKFVWKDKGGNIVAEQQKELVMINPKDKPFFQRVTDWSYRQSDRPSWEFLGKDNPIFGATASIAGTGMFITSIPESVVTFAKSPITSTKAVVVRGKDLAVGFAKGEKNLAFIGESIRTRPGFTGGYIAGEYATMKGSGYVGKKIFGLFSKTKARLSPTYTKVDTTIDYSKINIGKPKPGQGILDTIKAPTVEKINIGGAYGYIGIDDISKISPKTEIKFAGGLGNIGEPLSKQAKYSGKTIDVVSAQRGLFGTFNRKVLVSKPIPGAEKLSASTLSEINKLYKLPSSKKYGVLGSADSFKVNLGSADDLLKLNQKIIKESGSKGLLETSFFGSPSNELRISRLGILNEPKKASFVERLSGDVTYKKGSPQAFLFEQTKIEDLPTNLYSKLSTGQSLTSPEQAQLLRFQLTPSGKFKPIGFLGREPEVTLAPTELIKKDLKLATFIYQPEGGKSRVVNLYKSSVVQPSISSDVNKILGGSISFSDEKIIKKTTGFSSSELLNKPYASPTEAISKYKSLGYSDYEVKTPTSKPTYKSYGSFGSSLPYPKVKSSFPTSPKPSKTFSGFSGLIKTVSPKKINYSPISPSPSKPSPSPKSKPYLNYYGGSSKKGYDFYSPVKGTQTPLTYKPPKSTTPKQPRQKFTVYGRRFGTFKQIGQAKTSYQAFDIGKRWASATLGASFKVKGIGSLPKTPKGFRRSKKEKGVFVEKRKYRLSKAPEISEIGLYGKKKRSKKW